MKQKDDSKHQSSSPWTDTMRAANEVEAQAQLSDTQVDDKQKQGKPAANSDDDVNTALFEVYNG